MKAIVYDGIQKVQRREVQDPKIEKGDRVIVTFPVACGHCFYCEHNEFSQCDTTNKHGEVGGLLGYSKSYRYYAGGQAEYLRVPHANVGPVKVPEKLMEKVENALKLQVGSKSAIEIASQAVRKCRHVALVGI